MEQSNLDKKTGFISDLQSEITSNNPQQCSSKSYFANFCHNISEQYILT